MTREEILAMPAGREMDAAVSQLLGLFSVCPNCHGPTVAGPEYFRCGGIATDLNGVPFCKWIGYPEEVLFPPVSTDIAAVWQVVERIKDKGWSFSWDRTMAQWVVYDTRFEDDTVDWDTKAIAETFQLAVCRAALLTALEKSS